MQFTEYPVKNRKLTNGWVIEAGYPNSVNITDAYPRICSVSTHEICEYEYLIETIDSHLINRLN